MIDPADERSARLAHLRQRRDTPSEPAVAPTRRRSPAATAKIVTAGASTTALLGLMAGYGIADHAAATDPVLVADRAPTPPLTAPPGAALPATPVTTTTAPTPPQIVVVVIDGATGRTVSSGDASVLDDLTGVGGALPIDAGIDVSGPTESAPTVTTARAPTTAAAVDVPVAVDLAVPAPPRPVPAPAPAPAPIPQATTSGS